jgi:WD40 repeat protein
VDGHFDKELWGLCVSNNKREFFTGGEDKLLIKWDADKRKVAVKKRVEAPIRCLDLSRQNLLAVGHCNGVVNLHDAHTLNQQKKITNHKNPDK